MFLFSWCTVFVEGPNEAAALPVWFDKWAVRKRYGSHAEERWGVRFQAVGGNNAVYPWVQIAEAFSVPCVGLYDADVLSGHPKKKRESNEQILGQWRKAGILSTDELVPWDEDAWLHIIPQRDNRLFFCGLTTKDDFELLPVCSEHIEEAIEETGGGPLAYRWIAEHYPWPSEFERLFEFVRTETYGARHAGKEN